ncbi:MAG: glycosyltransferase family 2 protein [Chitinophagales bacterium]|nr:glycosyltransferase family 2 protein [Chitinophagales bacterium]
MDKIAVIIPAFNEEAAIAGVVAEINQISKESGIALHPVVINDCSTDNTWGIISQLDCTALNLPINLGIGGAVQTGFKYAYRNGFSHAVQVDGDGQHPALEISRLYLAMKERQLNVIIGSRFLENKGFQSSGLRRMGINYFKWLNKILIGQTITDNTSGLRMIDRSVLEAVVKYYPDEYPEPEAVVFYAKKGFKIGELPVQMRERQGGVSSIRAFGPLYYMAKVTLAVLFTYLRFTFNSKR